jgi:hypothetical protein
MWVCSNHPIGTHFVYNPVEHCTLTVTAPLDGFMSCNCVAYAENRAKLKSQADECQVSCRHIAQVSAAHCGWRSEYPGRCAMCGKDMIHVNDIPGPANWRDEASEEQHRQRFLDDVLEIWKELHER